MPDNFLSQLSPQWFASVMGQQQQPSTPTYAPDPLAAPQGQATAMPDVGNMLQSLNIGGNANAAPSAVPEAPQAPRQRRSILDTVGRIADVLAKVGGANALYQPTLDAREDRSLALGDHAQQVDLNKLKLATAQGTLGDADTARLGQAVKGVQAILAANPNADVSKIWPLVAQQTGLSPDRTAAVGQALAANPELLKGLANATNDDASKFGGNVVYGKDANGNLVAYQPGLGAEGARSVLPEGVSPVDPLKFVDTGGSQVGVGTRSGNPVRILPKTEAPGKAADRTSRENIARGNNNTAITIAGMPARSGTGGKTGTAAGGKGAVDPSSGLALIDSIQKGFDDLHGMKALAGEGGNPVGNVMGWLSRTGPGQEAGAQFGNVAAQKRLLVEKNLSLLQQDLIKSLPASATRTKFEQEIVKKSLPDPSRMDYSTAQDVLGEYRAMYTKAAKDAAAELAAKNPVPSRTAPRIPSRAPIRPRAGQPSISNW